MSPSAKGRGIGRTLTDAFLDSAPPTHVVTASRAANRTFYEHFGFTDAHPRRGAGRELVLLGRA